MRLELIRAHHLTIDGIDRLVEAGTVIDAAELKGFSATPAMRPLDRPAWEELRRVCSSSSNSNTGMSCTAVTPSDCKYGIFAISPR